MTRNAAYVVSFTLAFSLGFPCGLAFADDSEELTKTAYELQQEIEERQSALAAAQADMDAASEAIEADQKRIEELERKIPVQQERSSAAARELYKLQQRSVGIIDLLLGAGSLQEFIAEIEYMNKVSDAHRAEIDRLRALRDEVAATQQGMKDKRALADARAADARAAMEAAMQAQAEVQRRIEEEARLQAQIAAQAAAMAEQERANDTGEAASPETGVVEAPVAEASGSAGAGAGETAAGNAQDEGAQPAEEAPAEEVSSSVEEWAKRIDAYLAGSPLAGQGMTFAKAADEYGVDPRFSPAISFTESSKGLYCFKPHNAWGWGSSSWSSWEEAIYAHVAGLARGYGGKISKEGAKKYCPPNWKTWYERTLAQMEMI